jgi:TIGR03009 family protein
MKRSLGRNWITVVSAFTWLLSGGGAIAQVPEQHWQATPNYPQNNPPNYQPSTTPATPPATGNPATSAPAAGQYQDPRQPDQPIGPPQYPTIDRRPTAPVGQAPLANLPPDNRAAYPQDPRAPGSAGQGPAVPGQPAMGQPIQGPPVRPVAPQAPFVLSPPEAAALENLLTDWERRNKEIHVLESKFFRWKYDTAFGNGQPPPPDEGVLKFAAPDKGLMKIDAKDPKQSEQWLCDGKSIYQFSYPEKVVTEFVMPKELQGKGIGDGPLPFVFGIEAQKLKQRYFMRIITPPTVQNEVWLEAYPRFQQQAAEFSKVQVILQIAGPTKSLLPYAIQIYTPNGKDRTVYQLQEPSINPPGNWIPIIGRDWWKVSIPFGWKKKVDLPPPPVQAGLSPSASRR